MPLFWATVGVVVGTLIELLVRYLTTARDDTAASLCEACEAPSFDWRLVPLAGALIDGRCRKCGRERWQGRLAIELGCAVAFGALAWRFPWDLPLMVFSFYTAVLLIAFVTDWRHRLILNVVTYPGMAIALAVAVVLSGADPLGGLTRAVGGGLFGGGLFLALYIIAALLYRRGDAFGLGDVKLALLIGLMTGWPNAMAAILLGSLIGAIIGSGLMLRARSGKVTMPYGTALSLGALLSILWLPPT